MDAVRKTLGCDAIVAMSKYCIVLRIESFALCTLHFAPRAMKAIKVGRAIHREDDRPTRLEF